MNPTETDGIDFGWLGVDDAGHVAVFFTGGEGTIPASVLADLALHFESEALIHQLPVNTDYELHVNYPRPDDYVEVAERGLFAFDWCDVHRTQSQATGVYELVASPIQCLKLEVLPELLQTIAIRNHIRGANFATCDKIDVKP